MTGPNRTAGGLMLAAALAYAACGWHVFPLRPGDKRPAFPAHSGDTCTGRDLRCRTAARHVSWEERATTDPARIERAWTPAKDAPAYGIGIACGPSGLVVIDLDTAKPGAAPPPEWVMFGVLDGSDVLAVLADRAGQPYPIGDTHTVTTPSGGQHLYYRAPAANGEPRLRNTAGALGWLIDTRAHGGYVAAPPTAIPRDDASTGTYETTVHAPAAPLPVWLALALTPAPLPAQRPTQAVLTASGDYRRDAYLTAAVTRQLATITTAGSGGRNRALYQSAVALGQLVAGGELEQGDVTGWLETTGLAAGLTPAETTRTIRSGLRDGTHRPRTITTPGPSDLVNGAAA